MSHTLLIVTGSAADWSWLKPIADSLLKKGVDVRLAKVGSHNVTTQCGIDFVGFPGKTDMLGVFGEVARSFSAFLQTMHSNQYVGAVVLGDRIEILAAVSALYTKRIPVHHLSAGDVSGCLDDAYRDAISIMSRYLYTSSLEALSRTLRLRSARGRDDIKSTEVVRYQIEVSDKLEIAGKFAIARFHPETTMEEPVGKWIDEVISRALADDVMLLIFPPNQDDGYREIENLWKSSIAAIPELKYNHMGTVRRDIYLGMLKNAEWVVGNSSSFVSEAPLVGQKNVTLCGNRQEGRLPMATGSGGDVVDALIRNIERSLR